MEALRARGCDGAHYRPRAGVRVDPLMRHADLAPCVFYSMVRAAQASPDHRFCGVSARAGDPSCLELR